MRETEKSPEFWMVYGENQGSPKRTHYSERSATDEAQRLAREHPGIKFYVLKAAHGFVMEPPPLTVIEIDPEEMPF